MKVVKKSPTGGTTLKKHFQREYDVTKLVDPGTIPKQLLGMAACHFSILGIIIPITNIQYFAVYHFNLFGVCCAFQPAFGCCAHPKVC